MTRAAYQRGASVEAQRIGRAQWRDLAERAVRHGGQVIEGARVDTFADADLRRIFNRTKAAPLPVDGVSADHARRSFVFAVEGLLAAAGDQQVAVARLAVAAGDCVLELLDLQARRAADATWKKQFKD